MLVFDLESIVSSEATSHTPESLSSTSSSIQRALANNVCEDLQIWRCYDNYTVQMTLDARTTLRETKFTIGNVDHLLVPCRTSFPTAQATLCWYSLSRSQTALPPPVTFIIDSSADPAHDHIQKTKDFRRPHKRWHTGNVRFHWTIDGQHRSFRTALSRNSWSCDDQRYCIVP